jgi:hypothetical protein
MSPYLPCPQNVLMTMQTNGSSAGSLGSAWPAVCVAAHAASTHSSSSSAFLRSMAAGQLCRALVGI